MKRLSILGALFFSGFSSFANEVVIKPGTSITLYPNQETTVFCKEIDRCSIRWANGAGEAVFNGNDRVSPYYFTLEDAAMEMEKLVDRKECKPALCDMKLERSGKYVLMMEGRPLFKDYRTEAEVLAVIRNFKFRRICQ